MEKKNDNNNFVGDIKVEQVDKQKELKVFFLTNRNWLKLVYVNIFYRG